MDHARYLRDQVEQDLERKMVFVAGPRQVGKTTLALSIPGATDGYLNWDVAEHRERILRRELPPGPLWVFDEIHTYRTWRNYLKGLCDGRRNGQRILVTGSARLDLYRYSGDSLQGRYHMLRLHSLSVAELGLHSEGDLQPPLTLGRFPEPFFGGSEVEARRWSREYRNLLIREELSSLERVHDLGNLELRYFRDVEGREVDFVVVDRRTPVMMVECKLADAPADRNLRYLKARFPDCPAWQISASGHKDFVTPEGIRVSPAIPLLATLV